MCIRDSPESYDVHALIGFVSEIKAGRPELAVPIYSHLTYDILPDQFQVVRQPDVLIVEGLNILQAGDRAARPSQHLFASDFFDFTIYVDADVQDLSLIHISEPTRLLSISYAVFCLKKKKIV